MRILLGLLLIIFLSPFTVWYAESQHRAKDFSSANQVEAISQETGYVTLQGAPTSNSPLPCPDDLDPSCVYVKTEIRKFVRKESVECGDAPTNKRIIEQIEDVCDEDGYDCESCYRVEEERWETKSTKKNFSDLKIGAYTVNLSNDTNVIGEEQHNEYFTVNAELIENRSEEPKLGDSEISYEYLEIKNPLLVAGESDGSTISSPEKKVFVLSSLNPEATVAELDSQDKGTALALRLLSLFLMILGFVLLISPILSITGSLSKLVPILGKKAHAAVSWVLVGLSAIVGTLVWLIIWGVVLTLKNFWIILGVLAIITAIIALVMVRKTKIK